MPELAQPVDDGHYIPTVGQWSSDKHYYLSRYYEGPPAVYPHLLFSQRRGCEIVAENLDHGIG